ncbi:hypothetical protein BDA96_08G196300 [Sorghum bicolor]|uniref:F-box domain-containing protein n=1 Tax=Sorghum bicolor TaxID=4558 RepID=A0A921QH91_SORBI|nr:hypothetical protein BDA96_08G196300 [Sorghum bicolor]
MELPADVVEEILLRLPPADPASLVRAALVCKPWCRIVCARSFRRRFMEFHRTAPLLGFLCNPLFAWFVPTSSFRPTPTGCEEEVRDCVVLDARHGLVVLHFVLGDDEVDALVIWDPVNETSGTRLCSASPRPTVQPSSSFALSPSTTATARASAGPCASTHRRQPAGASRLWSPSAASI